MAATAAAPAVQNIVKEAVDVGVGLNSLYKAYKNRLRKSVDDVQRGVSRLQVGATQDQPGAGNLRGDMKAVEQAIQKVLDDQASLLALVSKGSFGICSRGLDALRLEIDKGFDSVMQSVNDESAVRAARELKAKLGTATLACNRMLEHIVTAAESQQRHLSACASKDIEKAERSAAELYIWANSFVPNNAEAMPKQSKLQITPYVVAMAYAARIQAIAHVLERDMVDEECDKITYLKRVRKVVDEFIAVLARALEGVMTDTSLLEVAMDYQLPMATCLTLMTSFRASVDELLSPSAERKDVVVWDDGLAPIRDVLHWKDSDADDGQGQAIELKSIAEGVWWATFTDTDLAATDMTEMRKCIHIRELCHVLGAGDDERIAHIALKSGQKNALIQLPAASALRATLCANITQTRQAPPHSDCPSPAPPRSFARTSAPPAPDDTLRSAAAALVRLTLRGHSGPVSGVAVCVDGERVVSGSLDGTAKVWSLSTGQHLCTFSGHTEEVHCVAVSPDGKRAVSGSSDKSVRVWSVDSGNVQRILQGHSGAVRGVAVSPDGRSIASGCLDKTIKLWNVYTGQCQATLVGHSNTVFCVAFSLDGEMLVSGSEDNSIRVWRVRTRALERILHGHPNTVRDVAVTPDGWRLVSGSLDETVKVWSLSSGEEKMVFTEHCSRINCVAVFPDGQRIASGSNDNTIRVWNLRSRTLELTLTGHRNFVQSITVSPDGRSVVSGSYDNTIKVWALSGDGGDGRAR